MKKNKRNEKKKYFVSVMAGAAAIVALVFIVLAFVNHTRTDVKAITTFAQCAAKYPVMESFPEQCRTPDGRTFVNQ